MQETEGFVIEAPEKMEEEEEEARVKMKDIFKGLKDAKQKEESFKKRQELKELERIIEKKEKEKKERDEVNEEKGEDRLGRLGRRKEEERERERESGRRVDRSGWSWSSGAEERRGGARERGPTLDFKEEIKMRPMELGTGPPVGGLGAKMLAKMGWREGEGLGRTR